jgi:acyl carrier protein
MTDSKKVMDIIFDAITSLNAELPESEQIALSPDTLLFGGESTIDSLSLVSVIVDVETAVGMEFDQPISLTDDRAMMREISPFESVRNLNEYVIELLSEAKK